MGTVLVMSPSLFLRLSKLARSPQGRRAMDQAKRLARDPNTKRKIEDARKRLGARGRPR